MTVNTTNLYKPALYHSLLTPNQPMALFSTGMDKRKDGDANEDLVDTQSDQAAADILSQLKGQGIQVALRETDSVAS